MSDFPPRDVLIDILTRLPIKTLVRCTCVCKSWYSLLTNPRFITTHLNRYRSSLASDNSDLLLIRRCSSDGNEEHYSLLRYENDGMLSDYAEFELPLKSYPNSYFRIIGSCNGLICLSNDLSSYMDSLYLWNPSIHRTMALPPLRVTFQSHGPFMHTIGFGFDSLTNDYKVVRIVYLDRPIGFQTPEVDIFSLSAGTWRNISHLGLPYTIYERAPQAYLKGAAHWLACDRRRRSDLSNLIVSFHMGDEVFGEIMVPGSMVHDQFLRLDVVRVAKFQESLSLIHIPNTPAQFTCCIWVMKEYGISESWTKQFNIDMSGGLGNCVAGFTRKGQVLFGTRFGYLVAYDPEAEQETHLRFCQSAKLWYMDSIYAEAYTESLVLFRAKFRDTVTWL